MSARTLVVSLVGAAALLGGCAFLSLTFRPPVQFPIRQKVEIPFGTSLIGSARILEREHVVRSSPVLQLVLIAQFKGAEVKAGIYQFDRPLSVFEIARAIIYGTNVAPLVRVTVPEGLRNAQIDAIISGQLSSVKSGMFDSVAEGKEGYLFPETYNVPELFTAAQFAALMENTFTEKVVSLRSVFDTSSRTREDVIIMASILEREADSEESMKIVSGILWKRIDAGMPLQVDASFAYLLGKKSREVTRDDLTIDSPYNTYKHKGLPPTPLNNPGLQAITAALSPTPSPYLYYLTGSDGTFHYARTLKEQAKNKKLYLN